jgi:hypothetical protein
MKEHMFCNVGIAVRLFGNFEGFFNREVFHSSPTALFSVQWIGIVLQRFHAHLHKFRGADRPVSMKSLYFPTILTCHWGIYASYRTSCYLRVFVHMVQVNLFLNSTLLLALLRS